MIRPRLAVLAVSLTPLAAWADPSLECSIGHGSQVEIADCLSQVETAAQEAMQIILNEARSSAEELDGITGRAVALPALQASQSAWEIYRTSQCDYAGALFGGGSGTGIAIRSCRIELTRARTTELQAAIP